MELRDIEYFAVVAECRNLGRAADALGLSQPALSKSLRRLEQAVHAKLVRRSPKGVELTPEGLVLLSRVRELRLSLQSVVREIADVSEGSVGQLRIGVGFARPDQFLASAFALLLKDAPKVKLIVTVSDNDLLIPALRNGELDLFVNYSLDTHRLADLMREHLYNDEHVVCASPKHRLAKRKHVSLQDLAGERWAGSPLILGSQQRLHETFRDNGLPPPQIAFECRSGAVRLQTIASSNLLDWTSRRLVEQSELASILKILRVKELTWLRPVGVVYRRETYLPPVARRFIEILRVAAKNSGHR